MWLLTLINQPLFLNNYTPIAKIRVRVTKNIASPIDIL